MSVMTYRVTGAAAIAGLVAPARQFQLEEVQLHCDAVGGAGTGDLTITLDGGAVAAVYDTILLTQAMVAVQNFVWVPARPMRFTFTDGTAGGSDHIDIDWDNANGVTYGLTVIYSLI